LRSNRPRLQTEYEGYLMPIRGFMKGTDKFPIQKYAIFRTFKEIKELRGGILLYAAQAIPPIDAEIAEKGHLWTGTYLEPTSRLYFLIF
jgi:hypothetical protein